MIDIACPIQKARVLVQDLGGAKGCRIRVALGRGHQRLKPVWLWKCIWVEADNPLTAGEPGCLIIGRCKACIVRIRYKLAGARLCCHIGIGPVW